jgi:hypothetical protein
MYLCQYQSRESSSVGRASASQAEGREFEPRFSLKQNSRPDASLSGCFVFWPIRGVRHLSGVIKMTMLTAIVTLESADGKKQGGNKFAPM